MKPGGTPTLRHAMYDGAIVQVLPLVENLPEVEVTRIWIVWSHKGCKSWLVENFGGIGPRREKSVFDYELRSAHFNADYQHRRNW